MSWLRYIASGNGISKKKLYDQLGVQEGRFYTDGIDSCDIESQRKSVTQAARQTGVPVAEIRERGRVMPSVTTLMQIAAAVSVDKIFLRVRDSSV